MSLIYNFLRIPTAMMGLFLIAAAFAVDLDATGTEGFVYYLPRLASLLAGIFILIPNHYFLDNLKFILRLSVAIIISVLFLYGSVEMIIDFLSNDKDTAMVFVAIFTFYNGIAFPATVHLRKKNPDL